ncbi:histidinol-phosphatase [Salinifilum ghardaiensis]
MRVSGDERDLDLALELADRADRITLERFRSRDLTVDSKPDRTPVTDADLAVEDAVRGVLAEQRPADGVVGEERGGEIGAGRAWILDPIDGTKNFLRGVPAWASLLALLEDGIPRVAVISAPALGRRWWAGAGAGAWANSPAGGAERLGVSAVGELSDAYLSTTNLAEWDNHRTRASYLRLLDACWESRAFGDFWHHCLVAEGVLDIAAEPVVNTWDVAAVRLLVEEAGGRFTDLDGLARIDGGNALSTNGLLHDAALAELRPD